MTFGAPGGTRGANIVFEADTGKAKAGITDLGRVYARTTGAMSTDALRLAAAQEKLNRAIERSGPESTAAKNATIAYRRELDAVAASANRETQALDRTNRELGQTVRGAVAGSGAFRSLGRSIAFASGGFLGAAGFVSLLRQAKAASSDLAEQQAKTQQVFGRSSAEVIAYAKGALGVARDQALEYASTLGLLFRNSGQTEKAAADLSVRLVKLAVDMASFNNTSIEDALRAIRSGLTGEIEPLRRYGVFLSEARTKTRALADTHKESATALTTGEKVLARYQLLLQDTTLTQGDYQRTIGGVANQEREAQKNWRNTQILIGQTLQPAYRDLIGSVNDYLGNADNQREIQEQVNRAVEVGTGVAEGLADAIRKIAGPAERVVDVLGGFEHAAETALIVGLLLKARRAAAGFGLITAASGRARTAIVADAAVEQAALGRTASAAETAATRIQGARGRLLRGAAGAAGAGLLLAPDSVPGAGSEAFANLGTAGLLAAANPYLGAAYLGLQYGPDLLEGGGPGITTDVAAQHGSPHNPGSPADTRYQLAYQLGALGKPLPPQLAGERAAYDLGRRRAGDIESVRGTAAYQATLTGTAARVRGTPAGRTGGAGQAGQFALTPGELRDLAAQRAGSTGATADDLAAARAIIEADRPKIEFLEGRLREGRGNKKKQIQLLQQLYAEEQSAQSTIDSITSAAQSKREEAQRAREAAARERARKLKVPRYGGSFTVEAFAEETKATERLREMFKKQTEFVAPTAGQIAGAARGALAGQLTGIPLGLQLAEANARTEEAREKILRRELRALESQYRIAKRNHLATKSLLEIARERNSVRSQLDQVDKARAAVDGRVIRDSFLADVRRIVGAYAPNAFPVGAARAAFGRAHAGGGQTDTRLHELVHETRQTNAHLAEQNARMRFPSSKFALLDRDAAYG